MKIRIKKLGVNEFLFFLALGMYISYFYLDASLIDYVIPGTLLGMLKYFILLIVIIKWFISEKFTITKLIMWTVILAMAFLVSVISDYSNLILILAIILSSQEIEFRRIVRFIFACVLFWMLVVIFLCKINVLQDYIYIHKIGEERFVAHSLGFKYYATIGYAIMVLTEAYQYLRKKNTIIEAIILIIINYQFYLIHTTRLSMNITVALIIVNTIIDKYRRIRLQKKIFEKLATILPLVCYIATMGLVHFYSVGKVDITSGYWATIVSRLEYSVEAVERYGIGLFGNHIAQLGNVAKVYGSSKTGFFVDSGYVYISIAYGMIFTMLLMIIYTFLYRYVYTLKDTKMYVWLGMIIIASCVNNFLLAVVYNPVLFLIPKMISSVKERKTKEIPYTAGRIQNIGIEE